MEPRDHRRFASHLVWTEEPDLLHIRFVGRIEGHELRAILDHRNAWAAGRGAYFLLCDLTRVTGVDATSRQVMMEERASVDRRQFTVGFGGSFSVRVVSDLLLRAIRALRPNVTAERYFVATEAEARALIDRRRGDFAAEARGHHAP